MIDPPEPTTWLAGDSDPATPPTVLARDHDLQRTLTQRVLDGGDLGDIARELSATLDLGVLLTSTDGRERDGDMSERMREALDDAGLLDPTGRLRLERTGVGAAPVGPGQVRVVRVQASGTDLARLVCLRLDGTIPDTDVHALEGASDVAALYITRQRAITSVENKYQGDFLRDVFWRRAGHHDYVVEHAAAFGWDLGRPLVVVTAELDTPTPEESRVSTERRRAWQERFAAGWRQVTAGMRHDMTSVDFSSEVVTLVPAGDDPAATEAVVESAILAVRGDGGGGRRSFSAGVSRRSAGLADLPEAYAQARRALEAGRRIAGRGSTTYFDKLGIHRLIALVPDTGELRAFTRDVLGELDDDTEEAAGLRETLQVLLDTNFNVAQAARAQFFHYNTMRYRLGKLERLLGPLTTDPHLRLDVAVALHTRQVRG